ncbi:hypothetical protein IBL26_12575 [Roseomonas aerophila]|uniref:Uncharacterized protein n=1 Tax=Teichococcus aerophilus TaxID=1224513 RepID=A0ABR7RMZ9_9PROT|nr:hypothetical protein [Pseudoroseomonas aerophila]MBC9207671.1 hypothetical protein [Pseudoroseomonas aerophila]
MDLSQFTIRHPRLFHLLPAASWDSFQKHGLLSARALCDLYAVPAAERVALLEEDRGKGNFAVLAAPGLPAITLRDQLLPDHVLRRCLTGSYEGQPRAWRALLNGYTFLWADPRRVQRLHAASLAQPQVLLEFDTARLLASWANAAMTTPLNSGAPFGGNPAARGEGTFQPLAAYPRPDGKPVVEVVVPYAIPDAPVALVASRPIEPAQGS